MVGTDYPIWDDVSIPPSQNDVIDLLLNGHHNMLSKRYTVKSSVTPDKKIPLLRDLHESDNYIRFSIHITQMLGQVDEECVLLSHHVIDLQYPMQDKDYNSDESCYASPENLHIRFTPYDHISNYLPENLHFYQITLHNQKLDRDLLLVVNGTVGGFDNKPDRDQGMIALGRLVHEHKINKAKYQYQTLKLAADLEGKPAMPKIEQFELENEPCQKETEVQ